jgi:2-methylisocitrate lyase-like PEP mutase family enzyme
MSGFATSAARLGLPDTGLISYGEMLEQGRDICAAVEIPVIGDADTGYGNPMNVRRTIKGYANAGFACAMIEDQEAPKRCGHTRGKRVVERAEALWRCAAFADLGADILFLEAPQSRAEMVAFCRQIPGHKMANLVEQGDTPLLPAHELEAMGYKIAAYPLTLISSAVRAMQQALAQLQRGEQPTSLMPFAQLRQTLGFDDYDRTLESYPAPK